MGSPFESEREREREMEREREKRARRERKEEEDEDEEDDGMEEEADEDVEEEENQIEEEEQDETSESEEAVDHSDGADNRSDDRQRSGSESDEESNSDEDEDKEVPDHDIADTYQPTQGEDIYGNKVDSDEAASAKPSKYVPPHLRKKQDANDEDQQERLRSIQRSLNNALNRLSEDTLISVAQPVAQLYSSNPTQMVHERIWKNTKGACVETSMLMTGLIPIYTACLVGVHLQTGATVQLGEYLLDVAVTE